MDSDTSESGAASVGETDPGTSWEDTSPSKARRNLRKVLQQKNPWPVDVWAEWLRYLCLARRRGETRFAAKIGYWILRKWEKEGVHLPDKMSRKHAKFQPRTIGITIPFAAEDSGVPLSHLTYLEDVYFRWSKDTGKEGTLDPVILRLLTHRPLGKPVEPADIEKLLSEWPRILPTPSDNDLSAVKSGEADEDKDDSDGEPLNSRAFCRLGICQTLIEALISRGETEQAIALASEAAEANPCLWICDFAPRGFLSRLLEPLVDKGDRERAAQWESRLVGLLQGPVAGVAEAGYRAAYFAKIGETARAVELIEQTRPLLDHKDLTPWRKLEFHRGAIRALRAAGIDFSEHENAARKIAEEFDRRNGNMGVSGNLAM